MNSKLLKKLYNNQYKELFVNSDLVISIPTTLPIFGGTAAVFGGIITEIKVGQRVYLGFKKRNIKGNKISFYYINNFQKKELIEVSEDPFFRLGKKLLSLLEEDYPDISLDIRILCEFERKHTEIISIGLVLGFDLLSKKIDLTIIKKIKESDSNFLNNSRYIKEILNKSLLYRLNFNNETLGGSSLASIPNCLVDTIYPLFHMQEKRINNPLSRFSQDIDKFKKEIKSNQIDYFIYKIEELINFNNYELNFNYLILSVGEFKNTVWYKSAYNWMEESINEKTYLESLNNNKKDFFIENKNTEILLNKTIDIIIDFQLNMFRVLLKFLQNKETFEVFIFMLERNIELIGALLSKKNVHTYGTEQYYKNKIKKTIRKVYPILNDLNIFVYLTSHSNDNKYIVLLPKNISLINIENIEAEFKKYIGEEVAIIYSSKHHGTQKEGIIIEQDIENNLYSDYYNKKDLIAQSIEGRQIIGSYENLIKKFEKCLVIDLIYNKILINGKKMTSKEIPSQVTTIEIMNILLNNLGEEIKNSNFSTSTYSKNKNDMMGKIILPLKKVIKRELGKNIKLNCKGSLVEFHTKLEKSNLNIITIKKIVGD